MEGLEWALRWPADSLAGRSAPSPSAAWRPVGVCAFRVSRDPLSVAHVHLQRASAARTICDWQSRGDARHRAVIAPRCSACSLMRRPAASPIRWLADSLSTIC